MWVVAIIFILLGVLVKYGKMYFLIAGYNTMKVEEKANYDIKSIARVFFNAMVVMGLIIIAGVIVSEYLQKDSIEVIALFVSILIGLPYLLVNANSSKHSL